jgi:hypothetical protein
LQNGISPELLDERKLAPAPEHAHGPLSISRTNCPLAQGYASLVTPKVSRAVRQSGAELVRNHSTLTLRGILSADSGWRVPLFSILPKSMRRVNMPANWEKRLDTLLNCMM